MRDRGVSISLGEGFMVRPGTDVRDRKADIDAMRELGAERLNIISIDPDRQRSFDQFAAFVAMAAAVGCPATLEFGPVFTIPDLDTALAALRHVGRPDFSLVIDTMHLVRSGAGAAELANLDPSLIGYVQLCDGPMVATREQYLHEARFERMAPGAGAMPLLDILAALPRHLVVSLEIPQRSLAEAGIGPLERLGACVTATCALLDQL
jgi:sugar phosphate isomerase/epimerase